MISTKPIGPVVCPRNPVLIKTPYHGPGKQQSWKIEIAADETGKTVVWRSGVLTEPTRVKVGEDNGPGRPACGTPAARGGDNLYFRVMQGDSGQKSAWSPWHRHHQDGED